MSTYTITSADRPVPNAAATRLSRGGWCCAVGGAITVVGAILASTVHSSVPSTLESYPWTPGAAQVLQIAWTVCSAFVLVGVIALARSGLAGHSPLARIGLTITVVAMSALVPAQASFVFVAHQETSSTASTILGETASIIAVISAVGFILTGIATLSAGPWRGPGRFLPLICGLFVLVVLLPVLAIHSEVFFWTIAGWNLCFTALGLALVEAGRREAGPGRA
jgi:hypothetical protein